MGHFPFLLIQFTQSTHVESALVTFISEVGYTIRIVLYWHSEAKSMYLSRCQRKYNAFSGSTVDTNHRLRASWKIGTEFSTTAFPVKGFNWTRSSSSRSQLRMLHIGLSQKQRHRGKVHARLTAFVCVILEIDADVAVNIASVHQNWFPDFSKLGFQHKYGKAPLRVPVVKNKLWKRTSEEHE